MGKLSDFLKERLSDPEAVKDLAAAIGVKPNLVNKWCSGAAPVSFAHFDQIISLLRISPDSFLDLAREELPNAYQKYINKRSKQVFTQAGPISDKKKKLFELIQLLPSEFIPAIEKLLIAVTSRHEHHEAITANIEIITNGILAFKLSGKKGSINH